MQAGDPLREAGISRLLVVAPNWLGDAVMALPALADVRRASPGARVSVVARPAVAPMFSLVTGLDEVIALDARGPIWRDHSAPLRERGFDGALLLTNSFHTALLAQRAGIRERWGYSTDLRRLLLTRHRPPPVRVHQAAYYQHLTTALGFAPGPLVPELRVGAADAAAAADVLTRHGWNGRSPLVVLAAGAAYGGAKRWPSASFAAAATRLAADGVAPVLIGSPADAPAGAEVLAALAPAVAAINLIGRTDLPTLAGVLARSRGLITNDSGAMHLAAALGVPVTAIFGPTDETATHPLGRASSAVLTHDVWCRPCMLRECPIQHGCMRGVTADRVAQAARAQFVAGTVPE